LNNFENLLILIFCLLKLWKLKIFISIKKFFKTLIKIDFSKKKKQFLNLLQLRQHMFNFYKKKLKNKKDKIIFLLFDYSQKQYFFIQIQLFIFIILKKLINGMHYRQIINLTNSSKKS